MALAIGAVISSGAGAFGAVFFIRSFGMTVTSIGLLLGPPIAIIGAASGVLGGLDVLVFTGGAGEHSAPLRADVCAGLAFLGVALDPARNREPGDGDVDLAQPGAPVRVLRIEAREDLEILAAVRHLLD